MATGGTASAGMATGGGKASGRNASGGQSCGGTGAIPRRLGPGTRLFAAFAALSLLPVLGLGAILGVQYRSEVQRLGVAQGLTQAEMTARLLAETQLEGHDLRSGLTTLELQRVNAFADAETRAGRLDRIRLRGPDQHVVFANDGSGEFVQRDDEVADALGGHSVALITRLNSDANDAGPAGERVVEVYTSLRNPTSQAAFGVLEIYLPYEPIHRELAVGLHHLYVGLAFGLGLLYLVLAGLAGWMARRHGRHTAQ